MGKRLLFLLVAILLVAGCAPQPAKTNSTLLVYTSFYTMEDFTKKIGGKHVTVVSLIPSHVEPHDWEPTPADIQGLLSADLFVYSGAGMEPWAESVLSGIHFPVDKTVKTSSGLSLLTEEDEDSHQEEAEQHGHDDDEEEAQSHEGHSHGGVDPHTWLSPLNARHEMENIMEALCRADPAHAEDYRENYQRYAQQCTDLDAKIRLQLADLPNRDLVVTHAAYGYFCKEYDLHQIAIRGFSADLEPSPKKMAQVIDYIRLHGISVIFYDEGSSPDLAAAISRDTGSRAYTLTPIETISIKDQQQGIDYFSQMQRNANAIVEGLSK